MTTETPTAPRGCGKIATKIIFRGKKQLFLCDACPYTGSGRVAPYETADAAADPAAPRTPGRFSGPMRSCGEEVSK